MKLIHTQPLLLLFFLLLTSFNLAQKNGVLDLSFGTEGKVIIGISGYEDVANTIALQNDGKILLAGYSKEGKVLNKKMMMTRYTSKGEIDYDFGKLGTVVSSLTDLEGEVKSIAVQKDNKIVLCGYTLGAGSFSENITIARLDQHGTLDLSLANRGAVVTQVSDAKDMAEHLLVQPDGKILVVGWTSRMPNNDIVMIRYNSDGSLDEDFGYSGIVTTDVNKTHDWGKRIALQSDGKILVTGYTTVNTKITMILLRYSPNGELDKSFGTNGIVISSVNGRSLKMDMKILNDNKILITGPGSTASSTHFTTLKFNKDGQPDVSFGKNGIVITEIGGRSESESIIIDKNNNLFISGTTDLLNESFAIVKYLNNGSIDLGFGENGILVTDLANNSTDRSYSSVIQNDGRIILCGESKSEYTSFAMARFLAY